MRILSLRIKNFRNFGDFEINFERVGALIFGPNGLGKTNLLEAITYFSYGKSFRANSDQHCINFDRKFAQINSDFVVNDNFIKFDIKLENKNKTVKIQDKKIHKLSELYNYVKIVYFSPDDIQIISGSPSIRRRFFDIAISQYNYQYLSLLSNYSKLLKQRNAFLKSEKINLDEKKIWDLEFAKIAAKIINIRIDYVKKFSENLSLSFHSISNEKLTMFYKSSINYNSSCIDEAQILLQLESISHKEKMFQRTLIGPHLDDYDFLINDNDARNFGSQGQKRSLAIALRFVQAKLISVTAHDNPILIFDDVLVDLDKDRNKNIIKLLNQKHQIFIATPNKEIYNYINLPQIDLASKI